MVAEEDLPLSFVFVFCPRFGRKEGTEHEKILFFHPPTMEAKVQQNLMGLSFAFIHFTQTFTQEKCQVMHTDQQTLVFFEPEPDIFFVGGYKNKLPPAEKEGKKSGGGGGGAKEKEDFQLANYDLSEYNEDTRRDEVAQIMLRQLYSFFHFTHGPISAVIEREGNTPKPLRTLFDGTFSPLFVRNWFLSRLEADSLHNAVQMCAMDKNSFLEVHLLVSMAINSIPTIDKAVLFYHDSVVWSNLCQDDVVTVSVYNSVALSTDAIDVSIHCAKANRDRAMNEETFPSPFIQFIDRLSDQPTLVVKDMFLASARPCYLSMGKRGMYIMADVSFKLFLFETPREDFPPTPTPPSSSSSPPHSNKAGAREGEKGEERRGEKGENGGVNEKGEKEEEKRDEKSGKTKVDGNNEKGEEEEEEKREKKGGEEKEKEKEKVEEEGEGKCKKREEEANTEIEQSPAEVRSILIGCLSSFFESADELLTRQEQRAADALDRLRYLYYNGVSCSVRKCLLTPSSSSKSAKTSGGGMLGMGGRSGGTMMEVPRDLMLAISEVHRDLNGGAGGVIPLPLPDGRKGGVDDDDEVVTEVAMKTYMDGWVMGKMGQGREIMVMVDSKVSNIVEAQREFKEVAKKVLNVKP